MEIQPDETNSYTFAIGDIILELLLSIKDFDNLKESLDSWCRSPPPFDTPLDTLPQCFQDLVKLHQNFVKLIAFKPVFATLSVYDTPYGTLSSDEFSREDIAQRYYLTKARLQSINGLYSRIQILVAELGEYFIIATTNGATRNLMVPANP